MQPHQNLTASLSTLIVMVAEPRIQPRGFRFLPLYQIKSLSIAPINGEAYHDPGSRQIDPGTLNSAKAAQHTAQAQWTANL